MGRPALDPAAPLLGDRKLLPAAIRDNAASEILSAIIGPPLNSSLT